MERIRVTTAAWNDLEKLKGQKSKRKKQAGNSLIKCCIVLYCKFLGHNNNYVEDISL